MALEREKMQVERQAEKSERMRAKITEEYEGMKKLMEQRDRETSEIKAHVSILTEEKQ